MAFIPDLSRASYVRGRFGEQLTAIGWLEGNHPYPQGNVSVLVFEKLEAVCRTKHLVGVYMGYHECSICPLTKQQPETGKFFAMGKSNFVIPGQGDTVYHFPELILHYIRDHGYAPPAEFCAAVEACPDFDSVEYTERVECFFTVPLNQRDFFARCLPENRDQNT